MNRKGFAPIIVILLIAVLAGAVGYVALRGKQGPGAQINTHQTNPASEKPFTLWKGLDLKLPARAEINGNSILMDGSEFQINGGAAGLCSDKDFNTKNCTYEDDKSLTNILVLRLWKNPMGVFALNPQGIPLVDPTSYFVIRKIKPNQIFTTAELVLWKEIIRNYVVSSSTATSTDGTANWKTYSDTKFGNYQISYPADAIISLIDRAANPARCLSVRYGLGYILVNSGASDPCGPTGVGAYAKKVNETVIVGDKQYPSHGFIEPADKDSDLISSSFIGFQFSDKVFIGYGAQESAYGKPLTNREYQNTLNSIKDILKTIKCIGSCAITPDPTVDWKTYQDSARGFALRYPQDWVARAQHISNGEDIILLCPRELAAADPEGICNLEVKASAQPLSIAPIELMRITKQEDAAFKPDKGSHQYWTDMTGQYVYVLSLLDNSYLAVYKNIGASFKYFIPSN